MYIENNIIVLNLEGGIVLKNDVIMYTVPL